VQASLTGRPAFRTATVFNVHHVNVTAAYKYNNNNNCKKNLVQDTV